MVETIWWRAICGKIPHVSVSWHWGTIHGLGGVQSTQTGAPIHTLGWVDFLRFYIIAVLIESLIKVKKLYFQQNNRDLKSKK